MILRVALLGSLLIVQVPLASADAPPIIPVQGFLTDTAGVPEDGAHRLTFLLYDAATDGDVLFTEDLTSVDIDQGHFIAYVGASEDNPLELSIFEANPDIWIEIVVDGSETISPRTRLGSVPFAASAQYCSEAQHAATADSATSATSADDAATLGGQPPASYAPAAHTHTLVDCQDIAGPCGTGIDGMPLEYLDRVQVQCPVERPFMKGFNFNRCAGAGMLAVVTCCALGAP